MPLRRTLSLLFVALLAALPAYAQQSLLYAGGVTSVPLQGDLQGLGPSAGLGLSLTGLTESVFEGGLTGSAERFLGEDGATVLTLGATVRVQLGPEQRSVPYVFMNGGLYRLQLPDRSTTTHHFAAGIGGRLVRRDGFGFFAEVYAAAASTRGTRTVTLQGTTRAGVFMRVW